MPLYKYECTKCGNVFDKLRLIAERNDKIKCKRCKNKKCDRVLEMPFVQMGKAGSVIDKGDKFWNGAEKVRVKNLNKRKNHEVEQAVYGDKKMQRDISNTIDNYTRTGNEEAAEQVEKNIDRCKHGKTRNSRIYSRTS